MSDYCSRASTSITFSARQTGGPVSRFWAGKSNAIKNRSFGEDDLTSSGCLLSRAYFVRL
jgi:hypothetical protein